MAKRVKTLYELKWRARLKLAVGIVATVGFLALTATLIVLSAGLPIIAAAAVIGIVAATITIGDYRRSRRKIKAKQKLDRGLKAYAAQEAQEKTSLIQPERPATPRASVSLTHKTNHPQVGMGHYAPLPRYDDMQLPLIQKRRAMPEFERPGIERDPFFTILTRIIKENESESSLIELYRYVGALDKATLESHLQRMCTEAKYYPKSIEIIKEAIHFCDKPTSVKDLLHEITNTLNALNNPGDIDKKLESLTAIEAKMTVINTTLSDYPNERIPEPLRKIREDFTNLQNRISSMRSQFETSPDRDY